MTFAVPSVISLVLNSVYNLVDQLFIGQKIGYLGNAATNIIFPLTVLGIALSIMFGDGAAAYVSLQLGEGDKAKASKGAGNAIIMVSGLGIVLGIVVSIFLVPICNFMGASQAIMPYAVEYGRIIALGLPFTMFAGAGNALIRADGRPGLSMLSMAVGALTNIVLDPIFIFGLDWGMAGAAWATIIGQVLSAAITLGCLSHTKNLVLGRPAFKLSTKTLSRVASLGISSFITQAALVIVISLHNKLLSGYGAASVYGAEIPLAAHGITMKVNQIVISVILGLATGCQPIMGYNYGAKQYARVRRTILTCIGLSLVVTTAATLVYQFSPMTIIRLFGAESDLYNQFAMKSMRIYLLCTVLNGVTISSSVFFQAIGKPLLATISSLSRQMIFIIPAALILCRIIGVEGVLWSGPVADSLAFVITFIMLARELKKLQIQGEKVRPLATNTLENA